MSETKRIKIRYNCTLCFCLCFSLFMQCYWEKRCIHIICTLQICWVWQKVRSEDDRGFQRFLDTVQYKCTGILRYERVFGPGYVSTGGLGMLICFIYFLLTSRLQQAVNYGNFHSLFSDLVDVIEQRQQKNLLPNWISSLAKKS